MSLEGVFSYRIGRHGGRLAARVRCGSAIARRARVVVDVVRVCVSTGNLQTVF